MLSSRRHAYLTRPIPQGRTKSPVRTKKKKLFYATSIDDFLQSQSMKPMISQDQKVRQIEDNLTTSLIGLSNRWDIFNAHRNAFDQIIQSFKTKSNSMIKVKTGYDQFINSLKSENDAEVEKIDNIKKSSDQIIANLSLEREKIKAKRESLHKLIDQVNTINRDLVSENDDLQNKIRNLMLIISEKTTIINEKKNQLTDLKAVFTNHIEKQEKSLSVNQNLTKKVNKLNNSLHDLTVEVEKSLDSLYDHRSSFYFLQRNANHLKSHLNNLQEEVNDKYMQIEQLKSRNTEVNSAIQLISDNTDKIVKQKQEIEKAIKILREKSSIK